MEGGGRETGLYVTELGHVAERRLWDLAEAHHGVISLDQLRALGLSADAVRKRVAAGRLRRVHRGVYSLWRSRLDARGRRMAAVLACGEGAVISHGTAGDALGILPRASAMIEVTIPRRSGRSRPGITIHRSLTLDSEDCTTVDAIPCTSVARTLADLATRVDERTLARAIENAERLRLFDGAKLHGAGGRLRAALRDYAGEPPPTRRELERRALALFAEAGLPSPAVNTLVETLEVDFCWPDRRLIIEADSFEFHGTRAAFERDRRRDQQLRATGWTTIRVTWRQLHEHPGEVIAAIAG